MTLRLLGTIAVLCLGVSVADASGGEGAKKNVLSPDLVNSAVTLLVFGTLTAVLYKTAWGPILKGLHAREEAQFKAIEDARLAKEEAAAMRTSLQAESQAAQDKIRGLMEEARKDAERLRAAEREAGQREAAAERERAKREIDAAREQAIQELHHQSVRLAALMSSKAMRRSMTSDDHGRLLEESISELAKGVSHN